MSNTSNSPRTFILMNLSDVQSIEGMLLTIIESLGLQMTQQNAVKSLVRQAIRDEVHKPYRVWITDEMSNAAHEEWQQYQGYSFNHEGARLLEKKSK